MSWVLLIWNLLMVAWIVGVLFAARNNEDCINRGGLRVCNEAGSLAVLGIAVVIVIAVFGDLILGIIWLLTRGAKHPCPACGQPVRGKQRCKACGSDGGSVKQTPPFASDSAQASVPPPAAVPAGWYPDPQIAGHLRYWDGYRWTAEVRESTPR